jgi:hypothetical protein
MCHAQSLFPHYGLRLSRQGLAAQTGSQPLACPPALLTIRRFREAAGWRETDPARDTDLFYISYTLPAWREYANGTVKRDSNHMNMTTFSVKS